MNRSSASETSPGTRIPSASRYRQSASSPAEKKKLAEDVQKLLTSNPPEGEDPDAKLYQQLSSLSGPLFNKARPSGKQAKEYLSEESEVVKYLVEIGAPDSNEEHSVPAAEEEEQ